jgi:hypothetical protein
MSEQTEFSLPTQIVYEQDKAAIDVQISTAKAFPRNITRSIQNALAIVTIDPETAAICNYSVPRGGKAITGPSVHLAKILAQCWGNMRIEAKVVAVDGTHVTSEGICFDLENNLAIKAQVKRSITGRTGRFSEDMITVTGNAANSIALRNAILSVIPKGVVDKVYSEAKKVIAGDLSDETKLIAKRKQVFDKLRDTFSVTDKEILTAIGKAAIEYVTADDIIVLIGIGTAIKDGDTTVDQAFRGKKETPADTPITPEQLQTLLDEKIAFLTKPEFDSAKRIIENKEVDSYKKLFDLLTSKTE